MKMLHDDFEAWIRDRARACMDQDDIDQACQGELDFDSGEYTFHDTVVQAQWEAWQAATESSQEFWMITISYSSGDLSTICIDETPASWLIKWGGNIGDARHKKHIVFAMPITEDEFKELDQLRP